MFGRKNKNRAEQGRRRPEGRPVRSRPFSYYKNSSGENSSPRKAEKTVDLSRVGKGVRLIPTLLAVVVIIGSILFSLTLTAHPSVETVNDEPSLYRDPEEYALVAEEIINQSIGNRTKLTINTESIETAILDKFPELDAVVLRLPVLGRKPTLVLGINNPSILLAGNTKTYVLDRSGVAVSGASVLPQQARTGLPVLRDQSGIEITTGKQAVTTDTVTFVMIVLEQLKAKGLTVSELTLPLTGANQLDIHIKGLGYYVKTDLMSDARKQIGSFLAVKDDLEGKGVTPRDYIDVRAGEKVFYK